MQHHRPSAPVSFTTMAQWAARLQELGTLDKAPHEALLQALHEAQHGHLEQAHEPLLTVLLFGSSGVGKSQLLNALAGEAIAPTHFLRPTTRIPTVYAHEAVQAERLFEYGDTLGHLTRLPAAFQRHQREELRHMVLIDAPDIDSHVPEHRAQVMQLLPAMDVVLYVVTPESYKNDRGWQTVLQERGRRAFAFVMNKWDREGKRPISAGQMDVDDDFLTLLQQGGYAQPLLFRVSAAYWVARHEHATTTELAPAAGEQCPELQRWLLHELSTSRIAAIQRQRRRALWGSLAAAVSTAQPATVAEQPWQEAVIETLSRLRNAGWQVLSPRLATQARLLAQGYGMAACPSSRGPFGLCLRGMTACRLGLRQIQQVLAAAPWSSGQMRRTLTAEGTPLLGLDVAPTRLVPLIEEHLMSLECQARRHHVPLPWLSERWRALAAAVPARLEASVEPLTTGGLALPLSQGRMILSRVVLAIMEVLLSAFLGLVVWRLATTFIDSYYLGVGFVAHVLALFVCLVWFGYMALSWCLPQPEQLIRRQLEAQLGAAWDSAVADLERAAAEVLAELQTLQRQGEQLMQAVTAAIRACSPEPHDGPSADPDTARLFALPER